MRISVVVATYNGEKYILEQLESIYFQKRMVDEVLIFDDCSTDNTYLLCQNFIREKKAVNWQVKINNKNLGYVSNFMHGIEMAKGDIILLCDQDDIWLPERVDVMETIMKENSQIGSLTTTIARCDESGNIITKHVKHPHCLSNRLSIVSETNFFKFHAYLGMSMAVRKSMFNAIPYRAVGTITHDILINMYAVSQRMLYHLDKVLTVRRSCPSSTSNSRIDRERKSSFQGNRKMQAISRNIELLQPVLFNIDNVHFNNLMTNFCNNYKKRFSYMKEKSALNWLKNITNLKYYDGIKDYLSDLVFMFTRGKNNV